MSPSMPKKGKNQTKLEQTQPVHTSHSNGSPIQTTKRFGSPDRSKSNKLDLYTARHAMRTSLIENCTAVTIEILH
jgi:hypothetical protein